MHVKSKQPWQNIVGGYPNPYIPRPTFTTKITRKKISVLSAKPKIMLMTKHCLHCPAYSMKASCVKVSCVKVV